MLKNNTGYDLKQLFVGSEGTLGVVTRANLKIFPAPISTVTAFCGLPSYAAALALLRRARSRLGGSLSAFEAMWPDFYDLAMTDQARAPLQGRHDFYVLLDAQGADPAADAERFEAMIGDALEAGEIEDAVIAQSTQQARDLWKIRDLPAEFGRLFWPVCSFDVSTSTGSIGAFRDDLDRRIKAEFPHMPAIYFGHIADANLHMSYRTVGGEDHGRIKQLVYETVRDFKGSVSAEHGIGTEKRPYLSYSRSPEEIGLMGDLKRLLDPKGILNPGKVLGG
jgi:FAD/FMN-containing dehydrogenase